MAEVVGMLIEKKGQGGPTPQELQAAVADVARVLSLVVATLGKANVKGADLEHSVGAETSAKGAGPKSV